MSGGEHSGETTVKSIYTGKNTPDSGVKPSLMGSGLTGRPGNDKKTILKIIYPALILFFIIINQSAYSDENPITVSSREVNQGGVIFVRIKEKDNKEPVLKWMNREVPLLYRSHKKIYEGFIAADLAQDPGTYVLNLTYEPSGIKKQMEIEVTAKDYGVRKITIADDSKVNLNEKDLARATRESDHMNKLWGNSISAPFWERPFIMPLDSEVIGNFGRRSMINDQPRSPHTGVDMRGNRGTPVKACNDGLVVLTGDHFFTGNTVVIDHGAGILSMYFHLDKINVMKGDKISRGEVLGTVGSTGRVTGPHLHWGIRVDEQRVDPVGFVKISNKLEE
jgi:murein DD-endopeptidase MepM/ murein hydrolase activator NlpD